MPTPGSPGPDDPWFVVLPDSDAAGPSPRRSAPAGSHGRGSTTPPAGPGSSGPGPTPAALTARAGSTALLVLGQHAGPDRLLADARRPRPHRRRRSTGSPGRWSAAPTCSPRWTAGSGCRAPSPASGGSSPPTWRRPGRGRPCRRAGRADRRRPRRAAAGAAPARTRTSSTRSPACRSGAGWTCWPADRTWCSTATGRPAGPLVDARRSRCCRWPRARRRCGRRCRPRSPPASAGRELVSCDLGGLDSTAVCSLAAGREATVVAYTGGEPRSAGRRRRLGRAHGRRADATSSTTSSRPRRCRWSSPGSRLRRPARRAVLGDRGPRPLADHRPAGRRARLRGCT